jgi:hypothetical protein
VDKIASALMGVAGCNINIMAPDTPAAQAAAKRLLDIFGSCGFSGQIITAPNVPLASSLELQSHCQNAAAALAVQTALHDGGFPAPLLIDDRLPIEAILICVGRRGLF